MATIVPSRPPNWVPPHLRGRGNATSLNLAHSRVSMPASLENKDTNAPMQLVSSPVKGVTSVACEVSTGPNQWNFTGTPSGPQSTQSSSPTVMSIIPPASPQAENSTVTTTSPKRMPTSYNVRAQGGTVASPSHIHTAPGKSKALQRSKWPTAAEQRPPPKKYKRSIAWASTNEHSDPESARADNGYGAAKHCKDDTGYQLADWNGDWAPAPVDWDIRPSFQDPDFLDGVEIWRKGSEASIENMDITDFENYDEELVWWSYHLSPTPIPGDVEPEIPLDPESMPFWLTFTSPTSQYIARPPTPEVDGINPDEEDAKQSQARTKDYGSQDAAVMYTDKQLRRKNRRSERRKQERTTVEERKTNYVAPINPHQPKVNIYLRPAFPGDMQQIKSIYNHHVQFTVFCPEGRPRTTHQMLERFQDIAENKLPFLVAVERGGGNRIRTLQQVDKVVGFAYADDYNDINGMYRYAAELEVFTHPEYFMKGVAKCLMDKMMYLLDPDYVERGGYPFLGDGLHLGSGGGRVIGTVICHVPYDAEDSSRISWVAKWLGQWRFEKICDIPNLGIKLNRHVNLAIFHKKTGARIDPRKAM
ncbi:hypothetical protein LTR39_003925 [Cryomyces antarcticus]|nr:hypothetical protein LTR39_003925 [Cryomyces antarcticus]